jgi:hypothetical protein
MTTGQGPAILEHLRKWASSVASTLSDAELLTRFSTGREEGAFSALMLRHSGLD